MPDILSEFRPSDAFDGTLTLAPILGHACGAQTHYNGGLALAWK